MKCMSIDMGQYNLCDNLIKFLQNPQKICISRSLIGLKNHNITKRKAAVSCSLNAPRFGGVKMGLS